MSEQQPNPAEFSSFADWCLHKDSLSEAARYTVEVLLKKAGISDIYEANRILSSQVAMSCLCTRTKYQTSPRTAIPPPLKTLLRSFYSGAGMARERGDAPRSPIPTEGRTGDGVCDEGT